MKEKQKQHIIDIMKEDEELELYDVFNDEKKKGIKELIDKHKQESIVEKMIPLQLKYNLAMLDVMKQESLEEVALRLYPIILEDDGWDKNEQYRDEWIEGAKWQQERSYSRDEIFPLVDMLDQCKDYFFLKKDKNTVDAIANIFKKLKIK